MFESLFKGLFDAEWIAVIGIKEFLLCLVFALLLGLLISLCYMYKSNSSQSFVLTIALLPAIVCVVIMLVNGNIGTGVAIAGSFSLVRFRSASGTAKEICIVFLAMATGLICGTGYLGFAMLFSLIVSAVFVFYNSINYGIKKSNESTKILHITIFEDLNYTDVFDEIFNSYLSSYKLTNVKTTNMGSLFKLTYVVVMIDDRQQKEMIDKLRCRNGNLEISLSANLQKESDM